MKAEIVWCSPLDMHVCAPSDWTDSRVERFANESRPSGTSGGWKVVEGPDTRRPCADRIGMAHFRMEAVARVRPMRRPAPRRARR